ncbi:MAG: cytochrome c oxidase subunit [Chloroflexota bacterium]|jgi:cytochrome c oxidase subunit 2|nr:cytochrome c oxidase subunit [Chloroflexota bacterium]
MIMPLVGTLVGVPAVDVSPLNCAGPNACDIVSVYTSVFWIAMAVLVIVGGLIVYAALRFRRRDDKEPAQTHGNPRLEVLWTAIPVLIVGFVFIRTTLRMDYVRNGPAPQQVIQVTGVQWAWSFKYPNGKSSFTTLTIPVGQVVRLQVTSKDVLHSFWVPRLGGQIYAKPGFQNSGWIEASQPGSYFGQCNELCGRDHWSMLLQVNAVSPDQYQAFLSGTLPPGTTAAAEKVSGAAAAVKVAETDALIFQPASGTAKVGDVIEWTNTGTAVHNVVFDNQAVPSSDSMNEGDTFEIKFTKAGTYSYVCKFHEASGMRGTITVTGG